MLRYDFGGNPLAITNADPTSIQNALGFEAGFGIVLGLSNNFLLEGRLRAQSEDLRWMPTRSLTGADPTESSFSTTYFILDVGVGFKF